MRALVTGANKGIGFEIARNLGKRGCEVLVGARNEGRGRAAVEKLTTEGLSASFVRVNLNDLSALTELPQAVGTLDLLVNNAGISGNIKSDKGALDMNKSAFDYTTADLQETLAVNFLGTHGVILSLLRGQSLSADAKILNVTIPISGNPYWQPLAYITSKAALNSMTMAFGHQFIKERSQRQIFGVMPGAVATDLNGATAGGFVKTPKAAAELITSFLFDGLNHNAHILNFDGKEISTYEPDMGFAARD